jgi:hypothetical protein
LGTVAVNVDPVESDLTVLPVDSLRAALAPSARAQLITIPNEPALLRHLHATRRGEELWLPLLLLAAALLAAEIALASARKLTA